MVLPKKLADDEVHRFEGLDVAGDEVLSADRQAFLYEIGEMLRVVAGPYAGETGAVRMVRDGELVVRLWTYGTQLDVYIAPEKCRKLSGEEKAAIAEGGIDGPTRAIGQDEFDIAQGRTPRTKYSANDPNNPANDPKFMREREERRRAMEKGGWGGRNEGRNRREDR
jgi:hypothetical protein